MNAYQAGQKALCGDYFQYTPDGAAKFRKAGRWYTKPEEGDIVFFYNTSLGRIGHTGIVASVTKRSNGFDFTAYEGNTSSQDWDRNGGMVLLKTYNNLDESKIGGQNRVAGFGRPIYADITCWVDEIIDIAKRELTYEEKLNGNLDYLFTKHENVGNNNYTKYGYWYYGNKTIPAQWCAQFVSYCMYEACKLHKTGQETGWKQVYGKWTYHDGVTQVKGKWAFIDGRWYVFDNAGFMITGWFNDGENWYYLADDGGMISSQWMEWHNKWYYFTSSGAMAKDAYIRDKDKFCYVDSGGVWDETYFQSYPYGTDIVE